MRTRQHGRDIPSRPASAQRQLGLAPAAVGGRKRAPVLLPARRQARPLRRRRGGAAAQRLRATACSTCSTASGWGSAATSSRPTSRIAAARSTATCRRTSPTARACAASSASARTPAAISGARYVTSESSVSSRRSSSAATAARASNGRAVPQRGIRRGEGDRSRPHRSDGVAHLALDLAQRRAAPAASPRRAWSCARAQKASARPTFQLAPAAVASGRIASASSHAPWRIRRVGELGDEHRQHARGCPRAGPSRRLHG